MENTFRSFFFKSGPLNITLLYLVAGGLWIAFSDRVLESFITDMSVLTRFQTYKGWFYVAITGGMLYVLIRTYRSYLFWLKEEYRKTFEQYKTLLGHAVQIIIQVDDQGRFIYRNPLIKEILGISPDEMEHLVDLEALLHPNDSKAIQDIRDHWKQGRLEPVRKEVRLKYNRDTWRWYVIIGQDKRHFEHLDSFLLTIRDIQQEKELFNKLAESNRRFEHLFREAPVGYYTCDKDMIITDVNQTALAMIGLTYEAVVGKKKLSDFIEYDEAGCSGQMKQALTEKGRLQNCFIVIKNTKSEKWHKVILDAKAFFDEHGGLLYSIGNFVDITERMKAMEEIRQLNETLEDRVEKRTRQLELANKELESFAYSVSHDLRAPLRGIEGFSQIIQEEYQDKLDERGHGYLNRVRSATAKMSRLIDAILQLSRVSRHKLKRKTVNLSGVSREIFEQLKNKHPEQSAELVVPEELAVSGDPDLLHLLMQNLIENAWKFSSKKERILIDVGKVTRQGELVFYVKDHGVGFEMKYENKLFRAFQRLHHEEEYPGTGIGLATVQRIVHRHHGHIHVDSELGKGATFFFSLSGEEMEV